MKYLVNYERSLAPPQNENEQNLFLAPNDVANNRCPNIDQKHNAEVAAPIKASDRFSGYSTINCS